MSIFAYRAIDQRRSRVEGVIAADSAREARDLLRDRGLVVRQLEVQTRSSSRLPWMLRRRGMTIQLAAVSRELATLLSVGVDLVDAVTTLVNQQKGAMRTCLMQLRDRVSSGEGLAESMAEQADVFDELTIRMVEVGENAGNLDTVLEQVADYKERSLELKDRIISALLYPAIVFVASLVVSMFLMTVVVPMLLSSLEDAGRPLPWPTRILKGVSDLLVNYGGLLLLVIGVLTVCVLGAIRSERGRLVWQRCLLRVPILGSMIQRQAISRMSMVIATLMRSGIEYLQAAEIAARTSENRVARAALQKSSREINAGSDLGDALAGVGFFPPVVVHVFSVGQASGRLEEMLDRLADNYDRQVTRLSSRFAAVLEPILIIVLAVVVGFILFATLLPILEAGNVL